MTPPADPRIIAELLGPETTWSDIRHLQTTGSTNHDLVAHAVDLEREGLVLVSEHQSGGRGRFSRPWQAPPGASIALSVLLRPSREALDWSWLPLVAGLAVARALRAMAPTPDKGQRVGLKWPNDVLVEGEPGPGKVCGILAERHDTTIGPAAIIGMGINIDLAPDELPAPNATSLAAMGFGTDKNQVVANVLRQLAWLYEVWQARGHLSEAYAGECTTIGQQVRVEMSPTVSVTGTATGVDHGGRLVVQTERGPVRFLAGDVFHLRPGD